MLANDSGRMTAHSEAIPLPRITRYLDKCPSVSKPCGTGSSCQKGILSTRPPNSGASEFSALFALREAVSFLQIRHDGAQAGSIAQLRNMANAVR